MPLSLGRGYQLHRLCARCRIDRSSQDTVYICGRLDWKDNIEKCEYHFISGIREQFGVFPIALREGSELKHKVDRHTSMNITPTDTIPAIEETSLAYRLFSAMLSLLAISCDRVWRFFFSFLFFSFSFFPFLVGCCSPRKSDQASRKAPEHNLHI